MERDELRMAEREEGCGRGPREHTRAALEGETGTGDGERLRRGHRSTRTTTHKHTYINANVATHTHTHTHTQTVDADALQCSASRHGDIRIGHVLLQHGQQNGDRSLPGQQHLVVRCTHTHIYTQGRECD